MKIYAPVEDCNGVWASVQFINGVGETDDPQLIKWFKEHGYYVPAYDDVKPVEVVEVIEPVEEPVMMGVFEADDVDENDIEQIEKLTPNELREYAKRIGLGREIKNIRNKEKLLEIIKSKE